MEIWWSRRTDGAYDFKALGPDTIRTARYSVDGYIIADDVPRDDPASAEAENNFPAEYRFGTERAQREVLVEGLDASGTVIARGVGLIDAVPGTGVAIRQLGPAVYQISFERAPEQVVALGVEVDGYTLSDAVTGDEQSPRLAVRTSFTRLGERHFVLKGFNESGVVIVRSERTFTLE